MKKINMLLCKIIVFIANKLKWKEETAFQFVRYVVIGCLTAFIDISLFYLLSNATVWTVQICTTISWAITTCVHFLLNKYWNFKSDERKITQQMATYLIAVVLSYFFMIVCITIFTQYLGINKIIAKILTSALNVFWSFPVHKFITFGKGIIITIRNVLHKKKSSQRRMEIRDKNLKNEVAIQNIEISKVKGIN